MEIRDLLNINLFYLKNIIQNLNYIINKLYKLGHFSYLCLKTIE